MIKNWSTPQGQSRLVPRAGTRLEMGAKLSEQSAAEGTSGTISGSVKQVPGKVFGASPASPAALLPPQVRILPTEHPAVIWRQWVNHFPTSSCTFRTFLLPPLTSWDHGVFSFPSFLLSCAHSPHVYPQPSVLLPKSNTFSSRWLWGSPWQSISLLFQ